MIPYALLNTGKIRPPDYAQQALEAQSGSYDPLLQLLSQPDPKPARSTPTDSEMFGAILADAIFNTGGAATQGVLHGKKEKAAQETAYRQSERQRQLGVAQLQGEKERTRAAGLDKKAQRFEDQRRFNLEQQEKKRAALEKSIAQARLRYDLAKTPSAKERAAKALNALEGQAITTEMLDADMRDLNRDNLSDAIKAWNDAQKGLRLDQFGFIDEQDAKSLEPTKKALASQYELPEDALPPVRTGKVWRKEQAEQSQRNWQAAFEHRKDMDEVKKKTEAMRLANEGVRLKLEQVRLVQSEQRLQQSYLNTDIRVYDAQMKAHQAQVKAYNTRVTTRNKALQESMKALQAQLRSVLSDISYADDKGKDKLERKKEAILRAIDHVGSEMLEEMPGVPEEAPSPPGKKASRGTISQTPSGQRFRIPS